MDQIQLTNPINLIWFINYLTLLINRYLNNRFKEFLNKLIILLLLLQ